MLSARRGGAEVSLGSVTVNNQNLGQGTPTEVERLYMFVGQIADGVNDGIRGTVQAVNMSTDLDALLGVGDSAVKTTLSAAQKNGGQNWFGYLFAMPSSSTAADSMYAAVSDVSVEGVALCDPVASSAELETLHATAEKLIGSCQRRVHVLACWPGIDASQQSWGEYANAAIALTRGLAADRVCLVAQLWPEFLGSLAGRLANRAVTVADSPMRVATGSLLGEFSERPRDKDGRQLDKAVLHQLHDAARLCVPTWYEDYEGTYTSDASMLAPKTSDYGVLEYLRLADKAARAIYLLLVSCVANRRLNSTPTSMNYYTNFFAKPLRLMSHSTTINGATFPGEIRPPQDGAIVISWPSRNSVQVYMLLRPYDCAKDLGASVLLDLSDPDGGS